LAAVFVAGEGVFRNDRRISFLAGTVLRSSGMSSELGGQLAQAWLPVEMLELLKLSAQLVARLLSRRPRRNSHKHLPLASADNGSLDRPLWMQVRHWIARQAFEH